MKRLLITALLVLVSGLAQAQIKIAATVPTMGMLAHEIGGRAVSVSALAPPDRDAHYLEARPSMMATLRNADVVVSVGADLEVGWLPAALRGAQNPGIREGQPGYFEGAAHTDLIGTGKAADRSQGDVHPAGNPHFYLDPVRLAEVGEALARRLGRLDPDNADQYRENAQRFRADVEERLPGWLSTAEGAPGVVLYHKDANYLMERLGVTIHGYLEPLPGIPPTGRHLSSLVRDLEGKEGVILYTDFQPGQGTEFLERQLGWPSRQLPSQVLIGSNRNQYFALIDRWVEALNP